MSLHREAEQLLAATAMLQLLRDKFGDSMVVGSFDLGLLTRRDLDVCVPLGAVPFVGIFPDLVQRCAAAGWVLFRARFNDECFRPRGDYGPGLYFGLHLARANAEDWKLDLWGWAPELYRAKASAHTQLKQQLESVDRDVLLHAKTLAARRPYFGDRLTSYMIYRAAIAQPQLTARELIMSAEAHGAS